MKLLRALASSLYEPLMLVALLGVSLAASAESKSLAAGVQAVVRSSQAQEPVSRLIIRYHTAVKAAGQGGATAITERLDAAAVVTRSANLSGVGDLRYLKSVSPLMQVASLEQAVSDADAVSLMERLKADPAVAEVFVDRRALPHFVPNDPLFTGGVQWHLQSPGVVAGGINVAPAWDSGTGAGVVIAVLDGGYRPHADLAANVLPGYDFVSADEPSRFGGDIYWTANDGSGRDGDAMDPGDWITSADVDAGYCKSYKPGSGAVNSTWHGTHVAGIAAAIGNNAQGGAGVAYRATLLPVRVLGRCGGYVSDILAGARWAAGLSVPGVPANNTPAKVLNLSLGVVSNCESYVQSVMDEVRARGASIVASAGNDGSTKVSAPANCSGVLGVTAHTREGDNASYANVGAGVRISAPGGGNNSILAAAAGTPRGIVSTGNTGATIPSADNYLEFSGTSMAAPQVAGVLALMAPIRPSFAMSTLESIVAGSARAFPVGSYCSVNPDQLQVGFCGKGLLDAQAAVNAALAAPTDSADVSVSQRVNSMTGAEQQILTYTVNLQNAGPRSSSNVKLSHSVGAGLEIVGVSGGLGAVVVYDAHGMTATVPKLAAGTGISFFVEARVTVSTGNLISTASSQSTYADPALENNQSSLVIPATAPLPVESGGGGGCTTAPKGHADLGLTIQVLAALLFLLIRHRYRRRGCQN
jgi:serine protease